MRTGPCRVSCRVSSIQSLCKGLSRFATSSGTSWNPGMPLLRRELAVFHSFVESMLRSPLPPKGLWPRCPWKPGHSRGTVESASCQERERLLHCAGKVEPLIHLVILGGARHLGRLAHSRGVGGKIMIVCHFGILSSWSSCLVGFTRRRGVRCGILVILDHLPNMHPSSCSPALVTVITAAP